MRRGGESSLRSKRFRLVLEQKKTEERDFSVLTAREMKREPKNERGGREGEGRKRFLPHPLPTLLLAPFFPRSLTPVPRSLLLNRTETLDTQGTASLSFLAWIDFHARSRFARSTNPEVKWGLLVVYSSSIT